MPRPRTPLPEDQTSFARRLQQWMWSQRPPFTNGQLAYHLSTLGHKVTTQAVWNWFNRRSIPDPSVFIQLERVTGIPLTEWYELAGYPVPAPQRETDEAYWDWWIKDTVEIVRRGMRRKGIDERKIEQALQEIVADMRRRQYGKNYVPYVEREFATPPPERVVEAEQQHVAERPADYTEQPTQTLERIKPSHPERQERRAPRRRDAAKPKSKP